MLKSSPLSDAPKAGVSRFLPVCSLIIFGALLSGCKTEKDPDQPTLIGAPSNRAYLGAEYEYNFGAYGGEGILNYSLTDAPAWMALESINNRARQGVIVRGVPGLTGGQRGDADLGEQRGITLVATDGSSRGTRTFDITVEPNTLSVVSARIQEGEATRVRRDCSPAQVEEDEENETRYDIVNCLTEEQEEQAPENPRAPFCEVPVNEPEGRHEITRDIYDADGSVISQVTETVKTRAVIVPVRLESPSVTRVRVAFALESNYTETVCADPSNLLSDQECRNAGTNSPRARIGYDVVGLGSETDVSDDGLKVPSYLTYQADDEGNLTKGVLTFEPGKRECYIRIEVADDSLPEDTEDFTLRLTEVREGLASIGDEETGTANGFSINDNEPTVYFETVGGDNEGTVNLNGGPSTFVARLEGDRTGEVRARVNVILPDQPETTNPGDPPPANPAQDLTEDDYQLGVVSGPSFVDGEELELVFPEGQDEVWFTVAVAGSTEDNVNDGFFEVNADVDYQAGRPGFARAVQRSLIVNINEFVERPELTTLTSVSDFVPTDVVNATGGGLAVVGYRASSRLPYLLILDRKGQALQEGPLEGGLAVAAGAEPVIAYQESSAVIGGGGPNPQTVILPRLAIAYGSVGTASYPAPVAPTNAGGQDVIVHRLDLDLDTGVYVPLWQFQTGTSGNDVPVSISLNTNGSVALGGNTTGQWPEQVSAGGLDIFSMVISQTTVTADVGGTPTEVDAGELDWVDQKGSALDDFTAAALPRGLGVEVIAQTSGSFEGQPALGGTDGVFYLSVAPGTLGLNFDELDVQQVGSVVDDTIGSGEVNGASIWLVGSSRSLFSVDFGDLTGAIDPEPELDRRAIDTKAGFALLYNPSGSLSGAISLNDKSDVTNVEFDSSALVGGQLIVAGRAFSAFASEGDSFGQRGVMARVVFALRETTDEVSNPKSRLYEEWRVELPDIGSDIRQLATYRRDKLFALASDSSGVWTIRVYSGDGVPLN